MADPPRYPHAEQKPVERFDREPTPQDPAPPARRRWGTYAFVVIGVLLVVIFVLLHLTGAIGPGSH